MVNATPYQPASVVGMPGYANGGNPTVGQVSVVGERALSCLCQEPREQLFQIMLWLVLVELQTSPITTSTQLTLSHLKTDCLEVLRLFGRQINTVRKTLLQITGEHNVATDNI